MAYILRQSTAVDILIGPFVDSTDGFTSEAALSPVVEVSKNGQALVAKNDATTPVYDSLGYYNCELDATDTNTVGTLDVVVEGSATALPVRVQCQVIEEQVYDRIYAASALGPLSAAETNAECDTALTDYDPPTRAELTSDISGLNNISAADVNAQVVDVLRTDTIAEMAQGAPPLSPTTVEMLNYLYRELVRNRVVVDTNTANQKQIFADDGTTILYEKDLSNASDVTTIAEATTGA